MARTFPDVFPPEAESEAERRVFERVREGLPADYTVVAQVAWVVQHPGSVPHDGEADLVIVHPDWGVLAVEVKGGLIACDPHGGWTSNGMGIKDPFRQARDAAHELDRRVRASVRTRGYSYPFGYAVWFPDVDAIRLPARLDAPEEIICDAADLDAVQQAVDGIFDFWLPDPAPPGPGRLGVDELVHLLAPTWVLRPLLGPAIQREMVEQQRLTEQQFVVLRALGRHRRALIGGCAGSGKTLLALEKARRLADEGLTTLFTCFNKYLAAVVRRSLEGTGVEVAHFHDLCYRLGRQAGIDLPDQQVAGMPDSYFTERLPEALSRAVGVLGPRYDAIVVDEGQDFQDVWWVPLIELLRDPQQGILYIFFDDRQDLYRRPRLWPITDEPFELTVNCRSTQRIHRQLQDTMPGMLGEVSCVGPEGRPVERLDFDTEGAEKEALRKVLHRLISAEQVTASDLVVLTPRAQTKSKWQEGAILGNQRLTWSAEAVDSAAVQVSTIHSFKGLERPVVIMTELAYLPKGHEPELLYVGRSRARNHLIELWHGRGTAVRG